MCCAMTSSQHLVAPPSPPLHSAGYRSLLSTTGGTVALPVQAGQGWRCAAAAAEAFVFPTPLASMCSSAFNMQP